MFPCHLKARKLKLTVSVVGGQEREREKEILGKIIQIRIWCRAGGSLERREETQT